MKNNEKKTLKIGLLGYGKMGKEIEQIALDKGHQIVFIIDNESDWKLYKNELAIADIAIDFSTPQTAISNIEKCFDANLPIVVGTTGWYADFEQIKNDCVKKNQSLFYASNFSLGVNIFSAINTKLAEIMNRFPEYDLKLTETHHTQKLDAPSGTAISLAEGILQKLERKTKWELTEHQQALADKTIPIQAFRIEHVPGTHEITYYSSVDEIEIRHTAKSRKGFAKGAVLAAEWLYPKKGIYTMQDLLAL